MSIVISYSLFDQPDKKFDRSGHDPLDRNPYRYWLNIPFIILLNKTIFPDSTTRIYIPKILENNKYYDLLEILNTNIEGFEAVKLNKSYRLTEPSIWRIKALWDKNANFVFFRDLDSIIMKKEAQAMRYFMKSGLLIHNIRSTKQHNGEGTALMAGLSGFDTKKLKITLPLPENFEKYLEFYRSTTTNGVWGCDQETLINFFLRYRTNRITKQVLDTFIQPKRNNRKYGRVYKNKFYDMTSIAENVYSNIRFNKQTDRILNLVDTISTWCGEPINASGKQLNKIIRLCSNDLGNKVEKIITSNKKFKVLYNL